MVSEFVDTYAGYNLGDKVRIRDECCPPCKAGYTPIPDYVWKWMEQTGCNSWVVDSIYVISEDHVMFGLHDVAFMAFESFDYYQIEPFETSNRVVNF